MDCSIPGLPVPHCLPEFAQVHVLGISDSIQLSHPLQPSFPLPSIFPLAQTVKLLPTMQETQVRSLGWEDPLEKEVATHSSTLAWKIPWMEEPWGRQESDTTERLHFHFTQEKHMCLLSNNLKSFIIWKFFLISDFFKTYLRCQNLLFIVHAS